LADRDASIAGWIPSLRRYALGLTGNREAADDLVQETMERAWRRLAFWRGEGELRAWLFSILHNAFVDRVRADKRSPTQPLAEGDDLPARATQEDLLHVRDLDRALAQVPPDQREVLLLVSVEQMSYAEVARALGIPIGTVMSRLSRARARLRAVLEGRDTSTRLKAVK
jgi:RNA polymerase sigma-70 factor (ECF subfamily)